MNCPVCNKEAGVHVYHCARCGVYAHTVCWQKDVATAHKEKK